MDVIRTEITEYNSLQFEFSLLKCDGIFRFYGSISKGNKIIESCTTPAVTDCEKIADCIFDMFVKHNVSPSHFCYIIDEIIK